MNIEILKPGKMVNGGHNALRALPENVSLLDLLVRESIQNSLDAGKDNQVNVNFLLGSFNSKCFNANFEGVYKRLNQLFNGDSYQFLAIKDWGTHGLTGPTRTQDLQPGADKGNFYKLIYSFGENQTNEAAGGSRGVGKTIFSRIGIGLVVYYSRINQGDGYESRLIACLIESEKSENRLLSTSPTGIAWWGKCEDTDKGSEVVPITDEKEIKPFLSTFNIEPYCGQETGTTIIIPYIDEQKLLSNLVRDDVEGERNRNYWHNKLSAYIKIAVQRWYYPRLINNHYAGRLLSVSIDNSKIDKLEPVFGLMQALYNRAACGLTTINDENDFINRFNTEYPNNEVECSVLPVEIGTGKMRVGYVASLIASKAMLGMLPPDNNSSPFEYFDLRPNSDNENLNLPLLAFTRKPGMIVAYVQKKGEDGMWLADVPSQKDDYLLSQFVLESSCYPSNLGMTLEEYVRTGELGDHNEWIDQSINGKKQTIIERIKKRCAKALKGQYEERQEKELEGLHDGGHGRELAGILMPPIGYGNAPRNDGGHGPGSGGDGPGQRPRRGRVHEELIDTIYNGDSVILRYSLVGQSKIESFKVEFLISEEGKGITLPEYEEMFLNKPFELVQSEIVLSTGQCYCLSVEDEIDRISDGILEMEFICNYNSVDTTCYSFYVKFKNNEAQNNVKVKEVKLTLKLEDKGVCPIVKFDIKQKKI